MHNAKYNELKAFKIAHGIRARMEDCNFADGAVFPIKYDSQDGSNLFYIYQTVDSRKVHMVLELGGSIQVDETVTPSNIGRFTRALKNHKGGIHDAKFIKRVTDWLDKVKV